MAETITFEQGGEQQAEREKGFERQERGQRREMAKTEARNQQRAARGRTAAPTADDPTGPAQAAAEQAYRRGWMWAEEIAEDTALSFVDFMLVSGPAAVAIYLLRLFGGTLGGGMGEWSFQGVQVKRIPGFTFIEGFYRTGKILWIGLVTGAIYAGLATIGYIITHPLEAVRTLGFGALWEALKALGAIIAR